jgi:hypothetical protein
MGVTLGGPLYNSSFTATIVSSPLWPPTKGLGSVHLLNVLSTATPACYPISNRPRVTRAHVQRTVMWLAEDNLEAVVMLTYYISVLSTVGTLPGTLPSVPLQCTPDRHD